MYQMQLRCLHFLNSKLLSLPIHRRCSWTPNLTVTLPIYHRVFSTEELAQELGAGSEERAVLTLEEKQSNLREQYEQMLLDAYQADHLDSEDGVEDQFVGDGIPKTINIAEGEEEDEQCFDAAALSSPAYHPYPSKVMSLRYSPRWQAMLLDIMDNFPCCQFTSGQMSLQLFA
ncbi:hypothetical protein B0H14DRAFT_2615986 [Mycena olivaceomarginata]|nr:hypothetical protein B0H14DRAFT_2615986 [Mycena olivaceomarginata]